MIAQQAADTVPYLLVGLFGGGTIVGIATLVANRGKTRADEAATLVTASGQVVELSSEMLATYADELRRLGERVSRLEGLLDQRDRENRQLQEQNRWWRERCQQLEEHCRVLNMPIPPPVSLHPDGEAT